MNLRCSLRRKVAAGIILAALFGSPAFAFGAQVYLTGEVQKEGAVLLPEEGLTAVQAIILNGGLKAVADRHHIRVLRATTDGKSTILEFDWDKVVGSEATKGTKPVPANLAKDIPLEQNDIIVVPKKLVNF